MVRYLFILLFAFTAHAQTFDFSCQPSPPTTGNTRVDEYIAEFYADAERYGFRITEEGTARMVSDLSNNGELVLGVSYDSCNVNNDEYVIAFNAELFAEYLRNGYRAEPGGIHSGELIVKTVVYHELGHALLHLNHTSCAPIEHYRRTITWRPNGQSTYLIHNYYDIMASGGCWGEDDNHMFNPSYYPTIWNAAVARMFNGTDQVDRCSTSTGKIGLDDIN